MTSIRRFDHLGSTGGDLDLLTDFFAGLRRMAYVRGPEGIIVALAERIGTGR